jgi:hypothetical protein
LSEAADDGHCYLPAPNLIADAAKILDVPADQVTPCLDELAAAEGVVREQVPAAGPSAQAETAPQVPAVYLPPFYLAERSWPAPCCACTPPGPTASARSPPSTGTRPWHGCAAAPAPTWPPNKPTRSGSP